MPFEIMRLSLEERLARGLPWTQTWTFELGFRVLCLS